MIIPYQSLHSERSVLEVVKRIPKFRNMEILIMTPILTML